MSATKKKGTDTEVYEDLVQRTDGLGDKYEAACKEFYEERRTDLTQHVAGLVALYGELYRVHTEWQDFEAAGDMLVFNLKVGIALELQMAAINAEMAGLLDGDSELLSLSNQLRARYQRVVAGM